MSGYINHCREQDIPLVADLHAHVYKENGRQPTESLEAYYREVFFRNPWRDSELGPLAYWSDSRKLIGFMGVIPRRMSIAGRPLLAAVGHRLMVAPESGHPLAAVQLVRRFLSGPQDLSLSDGTSDSGRRFWEGCGGQTALLFSMNWMYPIYRRTCLLRTFLPGTPRFVLRATRALDRLRPRLADECNGTRKVPLVERPLKEGRLCEFLAELSAKWPLRSSYDPASMRWLLARLREDQYRGNLRGLMLDGPDRQAAGAFVYYSRSGDISEVLLLIAREGFGPEVFDHLVDRVRQEGSIGLRGRVHPADLRLLLMNNCILKRGLWTVAHARNGDVLDSIQRGDAFLTALDAELWLRGPQEPL